MIGLHGGDAAVRRDVEAADWLLRLRAADAGESEVAQWLAWCEAEPGNLPAFERMRQEWQDLEFLKQPPLPVVAPRAPVPHRRQARAASLAAGLVLATGLAAWRLPRPAAPAVPREIAAPGGTRPATLPDGSSLVLSSRALVAVDFTGVERRLTLNSGEAYFKVRHDQAHPFVVHAGEVTVTDIGTAFDVRREDQRVVVTVEEGEVGIASHGAGGGRWTVGAGYQLVYSPAAGTATLASVDAARALRWRVGELDYVQAPLGAVVADVDRYAARRIVLADAEVARIPYTGTVFTGAVDDWLKNVAATYHVRLADGADGAVVLKAPAAAPAR